MKNVLRLLCTLLLFSSALPAADVLLKNALVYDGSGQPPVRADVRVQGDRIVEIKPELRPREGEEVRDVSGLALAPGFIDMHSHADRKLLEFPLAENATLQGVTTLFVGQDGGSIFPLSKFFADLEKQGTAPNVASMAGHGALRRQVMGEDFVREATPEEIARMKTLLQQEMDAGAMGISTGLEYDAGQRATTAELIELSKVAAAAGGFYTSHVRDEGNRVFESFREVIEIGKGARIPVEITHIKLGTTPVWHMAESEMPKIFEAAQRAGVDLKADLYPYTRWQSTLRVIILDRDYFNPEKVEKALKDNGGAQALYITRFSPDPQVAGKTLAQVAEMWNTTAVEAYIRLVKAIHDKRDDDEKVEEGVIGESMHEDDIRWFMKHPRIMFSSDGELRGKHPRGSGAFPRVLGRYVREQKVIPLETAIQKMTAMPAQQLGLKDRGRIARGYRADLVLFDPAKVIDRATMEQPEAPPEGIPAVMVNGEWVVDEGKPTGKRPGRVLRRARK